MSAEFTYQQVAEHNLKEDCFFIIDDKVYDVTKFVDEHPGGEEVMLDVGGLDATESFEDVGHSDEARETLEKLLVGTLKRQPGDPAPKSKPVFPTPNGGSQGGGMGLGLYAVVVAGGAIAYAAYQYLQGKQTQ